MLLCVAWCCFAGWRHFGVSPQTEPAPQSGIAAAFLAAHNAARERVGTKPLKWSPKLVTVAQQWADHLLYTGAFVHSHNPNFGENLYDIRGGHATPAHVMQAFTGEARDYNYAANVCTGVCGHYTQVVWNDTTDVGCAVARGGDREVWVCEYSPPGNWVGKRPY